MLIAEDIEYLDGETLCRGFICYDNSWSKPRPCVMVAHDWVGRGQAACDKAKALCELGYVGFALDMYGDARLGADKEERQALMMPLMQDRNKLAQRMVAAFHSMQQHPAVDENKIAVIGYCFGGLCALDLARTGADVRGAVSFHGLLMPPPGDATAAIKAHILALHGFDDPLVKPDQVDHFATEMTARKADWQVHMYGLTAHSFTDPTANDSEMGLHYNPIAARRSWRTATEFLSEIFA